MVDILISGLIGAVIGLTVGLIAIVLFNMIGWD